MSVVKIAVAAALVSLLVSSCAVIQHDVEVSGYPDVDIGADSVQIYRTSPQRDLHVHVFAPASGNDATGAVVFFHGGGFRETRVEQFETQAQRLAAAGITGIVAEYRVTAEGTSRDDAVSDGVEVMRVLQSEYETYGIDPNRIAIAGSSAGGALAVEASADADAVVLFNPAVGEASARFIAAQPTIVFHSREDTIVAFENAEAFCNAVNDCSMIAYGEGDHGFFNYEPVLTETTDAMISFLQDLGW